MNRWHRELADLAARYGASVQHGRRHLVIVDDAGRVLTRASRTTRPAARLLANTERDLRAALRRER